MYKHVDLRLFCILLCTPMLSVAQQPTVEELEKSCEEMRELRLAPLREAEIEKCIAEKRMEPAKCQNYYQDYGDATRGAGGKYTERMFNDLPPCKKARELRSKTREGSVPTTKRGDVTTDMDKTIKQLTTPAEEIEAASKGKVEPISRDSSLPDDKRETEKSESSRDSSLSDSKRDSTSGKSTR